MDGREAPDLYWDRDESVVERGEHDPGSAGLPDPRLEAAHSGRHRALHHRHHLLVVRGTYQDWTGTNPVLNQDRSRTEQALHQD